MGEMKRNAHFSSPARGPRGFPPRRRVKRSPIQPEPNEGRRASSVIGRAPPRPRSLVGGEDLVQLVVDGRDRVLGGLVRGVEDVLVQLRLERRREVVVAAERRLE